MSYVIILAGGKGERFWPKSVRKKPKQFHKIVTDETMVQETFSRVYPEIKGENIFFVLKEDLKPILKEQIPSLKESNLIVEPEGKNTAPAIGLAAVCIHKRDPEGTMVVLTADQVIKPKDEFMKALNLSVKVAEMGYLVTFGVKPSRPATEFGYIEIGQRVEGDFDLGVFHVKKFREKPSLKDACDFLRKGTFFWNSGMFAFRVEEILIAIKKYLPTLYKGLLEIEEHLGTEYEGVIKKREYDKFENMSIDYGVMERAGNIACVGVEFFWDDVGSWNSLSRHREKDGEGSIIQGKVLAIESKNNIIIGEEGALISLVGIKDTIVVKEGNKILLCHKSQDQKIKELLERMSLDESYTSYL